MQITAAALTATCLMLITATGCAASNRTRGNSSPAVVEPSPTLAAPARYTLPPALDGLTLSTDSAASDLGNATRDDFAATLSELSGPATVGSYAGTGSDAAVLIGLPMAGADPQATIDEIFDGLRSMDLYAIETPTGQQVDQPGASMKCADATVLGGHSTLRLGICVESDPRGSSVLLRFTKTGAAAGADLAAILPTFAH